MMAKVPNPHVVSLVIILSLLAASIVASIFSKRREDARGGSPDLRPGAE